MFLEVTSFLRFLYNIYNLDITMYLWLKINKLNKKPYLNGKLGLEIKSHHQNIKFHL